MHRGGAKQTRGGGGNRSTPKQDQKKKPNNNSNNSNRPAAPRTDVKSGANDVTVYISTNFIGQKVEVQTSDGTWYQGYFHTASTNKGYGVVLNFAKRKDDSQIIPQLVIHPSNFVQIVAKDITFVDELSKGFKTDTAISNISQTKERELQPWRPDSSIPAPDLNHGNDSSWDQFTTNESLFGVKSSYDEDFYTTKLDRNSDFYRKNEADAAKMANKIEKEVATNMHQSEERGAAIAADVDEEALYGSVVREKVNRPDQKTRYTPPQRRGLDQLAPKPTGTPTFADILKQPPQLQQQQREHVKPASKPVNIESPGAQEKKPTAITAPTPTPTPVAEVKAEPVKAEATKPEVKKSGLSAAATEFIPSKPAIDVNKHVNLLLFDWLASRKSKRGTDLSKAPTTWSGTKSYKGEEEPVYQSEYMYGATVMYPPVVSYGGYGQMYYPQPMMPPMGGYIDPATGVFIQPPYGSYY